MVHKSTIPFNNGGGGAGPYVPYTGATGNVNLGSHNITASEGIFATIDSTGELLDNSASPGSSGYIPISTGSGWNWGAAPSSGLSTINGEAGSGGNYNIGSSTLNVTVYGTETYLDGIVPGGGSNNQVAVWGAGPYNIDGNNDFYFNQTTELLGVQTSGSPAASGHFVSAIPITIATPGTPSVSTAIESDVGNPSGDSVNQTNPIVQGAYNGNAYQQTGSGSYTASGNSYNYFAYNYTVAGYFSPVYAIGSFTDDSSGNPFTSVFSWSWTYTGGAYSGTLLGLQINGSSIQWFNAGSIGAGTTIYDDGSGSTYMWGTSGGPGTTSPDFVSTGNTYSFNCYAKGISPSGHAYFSNSGDNPSFYDGSSQQPFQILLNNPNGTAVRFVENSPFGGVGYDVSASGSLTVNNYTPSVGTGSPNSYGYPTDGTGTTPNYYRVTSVVAVNGNTIYSTPSAFSSPNYDDSANNWYSSGSFTGASGATAYILEHSSDGTNADRWVNIGNTLTIGDDNLGEYNGLSWTGGAHTSTPTSYLPSALLAQRNSVIGDTIPTALIQTTATSGSPSSYLSFQNYLGNEWGDIKATSSALNINSSNTVSITCGENSYITANSSGINLLTFSGGGITFQSGSYPFFPFSGYASYFRVINPGIGAYIATDHFQTTSAGGIVCNSTAQLAAGTTSSAPVNIPSGTFTTSISDGNLEYNGTHLFFTVGSTRYQLDQQAGFANPMTTLGDIIYENSTPAPARLAGNTTTAKRFLTQTGTGSVSSAPVWSAITSTDLPSGVYISTTADSAGQTGTNSSVVTTTSPNDGNAHQYQVGAYIKVTAISAGTVTITYTFTDEASNSRTLTLFPMGLTAAGVTATGFIAFPTSTIRVKANTAITLVATFTGVSVSYDCGGNILRIN